MTRQSTTTRPLFGVTLIEMMVSLAITTFVILVINQLFNEVVTTVARGTQGGEMLLKSRMLDERLAAETELQVNNHSQPNEWLSRMVGPGGRNGTGVATDPPGGFLAIVQNHVNAPLTLDDQLKGITQNVRSDQLMFVYDQDSPLDAGTKRLPAMAPSSNRSFTGDARDSQFAEYVRMWYGHVLQIPDRQDAASIDVTTTGGYSNIDLGAANSTNPNALAQDWVLGRHALLLTDSTPIDIMNNDLWDIPYGPYVDGFGVLLEGLKNGPSGSPKLGNGLCDVANFTLKDLINGRVNTPRHPAITGLATAGNSLVYQGQLLNMMFAASPLLTSAKPLGTTDSMRAWNVSPTHTYFMGGVSDFIVEWAGDALNTNAIYNVNDPTTQIGSDGVLDRDPDGRIKWYTSQLYANPVDPTNRFRPRNPNAPITYAVPSYRFYTPHVNNPAIINSFSRARDAFVWQSYAPANTTLNNTFTQWPWMIRIRYRLHDRRGQFEGREIANLTTGKTEVEKGLWYETIIQVNYQNLP